MAYIPEGHIKKFDNKQDKKLNYLMQKISCEFHLENQELFLQ